MRYLPCARKARTRGRVIGLSVGCLFVCVCVCGHKNEQFERNRAVYELNLLRTSQKSSFYIPHERERTSGSQEKQTLKFSTLLKLLFNIVDPCQKNDY